MTDYRCTKCSHDIDVSLLIEDDRILLKNLRILEITQTVPLPDGRFTLKYWEHAAKDRGTLDVPQGQIVKLLCPYATGAGRCALNRLPELAEVL